jgi:hypothetical protein
VPGYGSVRCREVCAGIDLLYYGNQQNLEFDFVLAPGADPSAIVLRYASAERVAVKADGDLVMDGFVTKLLGPPGSDTVGVFVPTTSDFFLRNANASGLADIVFGYGPDGAGWVPIAGDWDGDGLETIELYSAASGSFFLKNAHSPGPADQAFSFGPRGTMWEPIAGDWNGDGTVTIGLYDPASAAFFLKNSNNPGPGDLTFRYGPAGSTPIVGDWDGR